MWCWMSLFSFLWFCGKKLRQRWLLWNWGMYQCALYENTFYFMEILGSQRLWGFHGLHFNNLPTNGICVHVLKCHWISQRAYYDLFRSWNPSFSSWRLTWPRAQGDFVKCLVLSHKSPKHKDISVYNSRKLTQQSKNGNIHIWETETIELWYI